VKLHLTSEHKEVPFAAFDVNGDGEVTFDEAIDTSKTMFSERVGTTVGNVWREKYGEDKTLDQKEFGGIVKDVLARISKIDAEVTTGVKATRADWITNETTAAEYDAYYASSTGSKTDSTTE
jgi:hypothetical protein